MRYEYSAYVVLWADNEASARKQANAMVDAWKGDGYIALDEGEPVIEDDEDE